MFLVSTFLSCAVAQCDSSLVTYNTGLVQSQTSTVLKWALLEQFTFTGSSYNSDCLGNQYSQSYSIVESSYFQFSTGVCADTCVAIWKTSPESNENGFWPTMDANGQLVKLMFSPQSFCYNTNLSTWSTLKIYIYATSNCRSTTPTVVLDQGNPELHNLFTLEFIKDPANLATISSTMQTFKLTWQKRWNGNQFVLVGSKEDSIDLNPQSFFTANELSNCTTGYTCSVFSTPIPPITEYSFEGLENSNGGNFDYDPGVFYWNVSTQTLNIKGYKTLKATDYQDVGIVFRARTDYVVSNKAVIARFSLYEDTVNVPGYQEVKIQPHFLEPLKPIVISGNFLVKKCNQESSSFEIPNPVVHDKEDMKLCFVYGLEKLPFITFNNQSLEFGENKMGTLFFDPNKVTERMIRHSPYDLVINMTDANDLTRNITLRVVLDYTPNVEVECPWFLAPYVWTDKLVVPDIPIEPINKTLPEQIDLTKPQAKISSISEFGLLKIIFNQDVRIMKELLDKKEGDSEETRRLQDLQNEESQQNLTWIDESVLLLQVGLGQDSNLNFTWTAKGFNESTNELTIQLLFSNPEEISQKVDYDELFLQFKQPQVFQGLENEKSVGSLVISSHVSRQMPLNDLTVEMNQIFDIVAKVLVFTVLALFVLNFITPGYKLRLSQSLMPLQIIVFLALLKIPLPANVMSLLKRLKPVACFDFFPQVNSWFVQPKDEWNESDALTPRLKDLGVVSTNAIVNMGALFFLMWIFVAVIVVMSVVVMLQKCFRKQLSVKWIKRVFHPYTHMALAGFLPFTIAIYLQLSTSESGFSEITAYLGLVTVYGFLPISLLLLLAVRTVILDEHDFYRGLGFLYFNARVKTRQQRMFRLIFCLRRLILFLMGLKMDASPFWQLITLCVLNLFCYVYMGLVEPLLTQRSKMFDLANEFIIMMITIAMFAFCDPTLQKYIQYLFGWGVCGLVGASILLNYYILLKEVLFRLFLLAKKAWLRVVKIAKKVYKRVVFTFRKVLFTLFGYESFETEESSDDSDPSCDCEVHGLESRHMHTCDKKDEDQLFGKLHSLVQSFDSDYIEGSLDSITEQTDFGSDDSDAETGDSELDDLLRRAKELLNDQSLYLLRNGQIDDQLKDLEERLRQRRERRRKKGDGDDDDEDDLEKKNMMEDLDEMLRSVKELMENADLYNQRQKEIAKQQEDLLEKLKRRQRKLNMKDKDGNDVLDERQKRDLLEEIDELLRRAKELLGNQELYNLRQGEIEDQLKDLLDKLERRKRRKKKDGEGEGDDEESESEMDDLIKRAKDMVGDKTLDNLRLVEIGKQNGDLMEKLRRRQRKRKGLKEDGEDSDEAKDRDGEEDLDDFLKRAMEMVDNQNMFLDRKNEQIQQEKDLNERLRERNKRRENKKKSAFENFNILADMFKKNSSEMEDIEEMLRLAKKLIEESEHLNDQQREIAKQQLELLEKMRLRKLRREKEIDEDGGVIDPKKKKDYLEDIDEMMRRAQGLIEEQRLNNVRMQEIEKQQKELMDKLAKRRRKGSDSEDSTNAMSSEDQEEFDSLLAQAREMIDDKQLVSLMEEDAHTQKKNFMDKLKERRKRRFEKRKAAQTDDIDEYLRNAKNIIDEQETVGQQKQEIGDQQKKMMDRIAQRRGKKLKIQQRDIEQRKTELMDINKDTFAKRNIDQEDLDMLLQIARDIIDDQNLVSSMQHEIGTQQLDLNARLAERNKKRLNNKNIFGSQEDLDEMLKIAKKLIADQNLLNMRYKEIDEQQSKVMSRVRQRGIEQKENMTEEEKEAFEKELEEVQRFADAQAKLTKEKMVNDSEAMKEILQVKYQREVRGQILGVMKKKLRMRNPIEEENLAKLVEKSIQIIDDDTLMSNRASEMQSQRIRMEDIRKMRKQKAVDKLNMFSQQLKNIKILPKVKANWTLAMQMISGDTTNTQVHSREAKYQVQSIQSKLDQRKSKKNRKVEQNLLRVAEQEAEKIRVEQELRKQEEEEDILKQAELKKKTDEENAALKKKTDEENAKKAEVAEKLKKKLEEEQKRFADKKKKIEEMKKIAEDKRHAQENQWGKTAKPVSAAKKRSGVEIKNNINFNPHTMEDDLNMPDSIAEEVQLKLSPSRAKLMERVSKKVAGIQMKNINLLVDSDDDEETPPPKPPGQPKGWIPNVLKKGPSKNKILLAPPQNKQTASKTGSSFPKLDKDQK